MLFFYLFALAFFGSNTVNGGRPPPCNQSPEHPPRPPRPSGGLAVAKSQSSSSSSSSSQASSNSYASSSSRTDGGKAVAEAYSSSSSSSSQASSSSYASSSSIVSGSSGCNDYDHCNDDNATYIACPNPCPGTCENPKGVENCYMMCEEYGCQCNLGYVKSDKGKCILPIDCPDPGRCKEKNATYKKCPMACPGTCENPAGSPNCKKMCLEFGCECNPGLVWSDNETCIRPKDCPDPGRCKEKNATFKKCPIPCPGTCENPAGVPNCEKLCLEFGCECNPGLVWSDNGTCIWPKECPDPGRCKEKNATYKKCPMACPGTCENPAGSPNCKKMCLEFGCECNPGLVWSDNETCIRPKDCPDPGRCKEKNATFKKCPIPCPGTCENPAGVPNCKKKCLEFGCECNSGLVWSDNETCIRPKDCPDYLRCHGDHNAIYKECPNPCPRTCKFPGGTGPCNKMCVKEGCECKDGFYLSEEEKCVKLENCPGARNCSSNETFVFCNVGCPSNYCPKDDSRAIVACSPPFPCGSGCACKGGYLRVRGSDRCILASDCPQVKCTRQNEEWCSCPPPCFSDRCSDIGQTDVCDKRFFSCRPQCICKPGFYRNDNDICVPEKKCPPKCGYNEMPVKCKTICPPQSCEISYTEYACGEKTCEPGCDCLKEHLRNSTGFCIPNDQCPPPPTIPTCGENEEPSSCKIVCPPQTCESIYTEYMCAADISCEWGCNCVKGYLRNSDGKCVPSHQCPNPTITCCENEKPTSCKIVCPPQTCESLHTKFKCPEDIPCEPGCNCVAGYLRNSSGVCIPGKYCNKPSCGINEELSDCKIVCPPQSCESIFSTYICEKTVCEPGCNCISGYMRNDSGICIPSDQCFLEPQCDVPSECRATCANPCPRNCGTITPVLENEDGCKCKAGYVLSDINGVCIKIEKCPAGCNGDPNAVATACPWPCPSTCYSPNAGTCGKKCTCPGCQCKPGLILSKKNGKCIPPDECKCGNPCGANGTFVDCAFPCPNQNCPEDDSQFSIACKPGRPCPSGCLCKDYYRWENENSNRCVLASDCPSVECTRPNEEWDPCASECLAEKCSDIDQISDCSPDPDNCQPKCVCCDGYYRNSSGVCIPKHKCKPPCPLPRCRPTCAVPNPPDCPYIHPAEINDDDCNCEQGFILSKYRGKCIRVQDCPTDKGCNNDPNAQVKECPLPCPSTCDAPNAFPCKRKCVPIGCECKPGFILSERDGSCIVANDCEGGNPCGPNATFVPCKYNCPTFYCPVDDTRAMPICETYPLAPCYSGCVCNLNHRILSRDNPICIRADECPKVNCTRPHECWDGCPSDCQSEYCEALENPVTTCNTLVLNCNPQCRCKKGYYRNPETDICVCTEECKRINKRKKCQNKHT